MSDPIHDVAPAPQQGLVVEIYHRPTCDFCGADAQFDFKTAMGPWAYGCREHYLDAREYTSLGVGKGQRLVRAA